MQQGYRSWPQGLPLLIVHGEADKVTDAEASKEFAEKVTKQGGNAEYIGFPGALRFLHID